ncbi:acyltransferase family protein [Enterobacter quasiroggenkampii]|uniref:acyltransferase family protein n=1 Tax=Enterobacter quasiroggenkampii TaxID=2497436 RepID=UPI000F8272C6|nr:acyltransferase [Enterobacter quasiroggenkampii]MCM7166038.1 acyltransferase [Enterobacter quasiroggenkampii]MCU6358296.1 acyltransferase [Enterobacter quasiroggenkampii]RTM75156.1 acyltransferase [Enterobacter quasiroggenkampii]
MQNIKKLDALTSLRFFAAAMIVLGHGHGLFGSLGIATTLSLAQGVSFFFVLSGFILTYNYPKLKTFAEVKGFYVARFARILPSHLFAMLLLVIFTGGINQGGLQGAAIAFTAFLHTFLLQSLVPLKDVFLTFNGVSWSISTEMFFYIAFPLLITSLIPGKWLKLIILSIAVIMHLCFGVLWNVSADEGNSQFSLMGLLYINPWVRIFEFYIGVLVCNVYMKTRDHSWNTSRSSAVFSIAEIMAIIIAVFTMWLSPRFTGFVGIGEQTGVVLSYYLSKAGSVFSFAFLILIFAYGNGIINKILSAKFFVLLGEISFSLYLVHMSVLVWFQKNLSVFNGLSVTEQVLIFWSISLLTAWFLHRLIELPCRRIIIEWYKNRTFSKQIFDKSLFINSLAVIVMLACIKVFAPY